VENPMFHGQQEGGPFQTATVKSEWDSPQFHTLFLQFNFILSTLKSS
jgi:hypothetical protein